MQPRSSTMVHHWLLVLITEGFMMQSVGVVRSCPCKASWADKSPSLRIGNGAIRRHGSNAISTLCANMFDAVLPYSDRCHEACMQCNA